jgi:hypothetical protein
LVSGAPAGLDAIADGIEWLSAEVVTSWFDGNDSIAWDAASLIVSMR